jgi:hypothetical protein
MVKDLLSIGFLVAPADGDASDALSKSIRQVRQREQRLRKNDRQHQAAARVGHWPEAKVHLREQEAPKADLLEQRVATELSQ